MSHSTLAAPVGEHRLPMSYEEFLAWSDEDRHAEWRDGEVTIFMPATGIHQDILLFLASLLAPFSRYFQLGIVRVAPFQMRLSARYSPEPDILFVNAANRGRLLPERLLGPADLVIEVISAESVERDQDLKMREYEAAGVPEYWLFDARQDSPDARFLRLNARGKYEPVELDDQGRFRSAVITGFWLKPAWIWQDPLPNSLVCLQQIAPQILRSAISGEP